MRRTHCGALSLLAMTLLTPLAQAQAPPAACSFDAVTHVVLVEPSWDSPAVISREGDAVVVDGTPCGGATVHNTDAIRVAPRGGGVDASVHVSLVGGPLAPGFTDEPGGSDEIELSTTEADGGGAAGVRGSHGPDEIVVGAAGVNLNAGETDGVDVDVIASDGVGVDGDGGADMISLDGGAGTGDPRQGTSASGGEGDDVLTGSPGHDLLEGGPGNDRLDGRDDGDALSGGTGDDDLIGGDSGDLATESLSGGPGDDRLDGGPGLYDEASYASSPAGVVIDLGTGTVAEDGYGDTDTIDGVEVVYGSGHADRISGSDGSDWLFPGAGDNEVTARGGDDRVTVIALEGENSIDLGPGDDSGIGGLEADVIAGGGGDDRLYGREGDDSFDGGAGADFVGLSEPRAVEADLSEDRATFLDGTGEEPLVAVEGLGSDAHGTDVLIGDDGDNELEGGPGGDRLVGRGGDDLLRTGVADYSDAPGAVAVVGGPGDSRGGEVTADGHGGSDTLVGVGFVLGSDHADRLDYTSASLTVWLDGRGGADTILAGSDDDRLWGGAGADTIDGGARSDRVEGGAGADSLTGGAQSACCTDTDVLEFGGASAGVVVDQGAGVAPADGEGGADLHVEGFEKIRGTPFDDVITGGDHGETIESGEGDDVVSGAGGEDVLVASGGDDAYSGGAGRDRLDYSAGPWEGPLVLNLAAGAATEDGQGSEDTMTEIEDVVGTGNADTILGDDGPNRLDAFGGPDELHGRGGEDLLNGRSDRSRLDGGPGHDELSGSESVADYSGVPGPIRVDQQFVADDGYGTTDNRGDVNRLVGSPGDDVIHGDGGWESIDGGAGDDEIDGEFGRDTLNGGAGDDTVAGGTDHDVVTGGAGRDTLDGDSGNDLMEARDGEHDEVRCGTGADTAMADRAPLDAVDADCEDVSRAGQSDPAPPAEPPGHAAAPPPAAAGEQPPPPPGAESGDRTAPESDRRAPMLRARLVGRHRRTVEVKVDEGGRLEVLVPRGARRRNGRTISRPIRAGTHRVALRRLVPGWKPRTGARRIRLLAHDAAGNVSRLVSLRIR
jgi:Ca2+-binding RTX toxin-like protein